MVKGLEKQPVNPDSGLTPETAQASEIFARLAKSSFRRRFHLNAADRKYLERKGMAVVLEHAAEFIRTRLAPARPSNDGKQTPWRGHPVFVAQHATATCCRGCLEKWHAIPEGRDMTESERDYAVQVIETWLANELNQECVTQSPELDPKDLFD